MTSVYRVTGRAAFALALTVGVVASALPAVAQSPQPGKTYKIGFSQIVDHPALNATRQGFIDALKAAGFEQGKNLTFEYQNAQNDVGTARNIAEKFIAERSTCSRRARLRWCSRPSASPRIPKSPWCSAASPIRCRRA